MNGRLEADNQINKEIEAKLKDLPDYIAEWHNNLWASGLTAKTRREYIRRITLFLKSITDNIKNIKVEEITNSVVSSYIISCQNIEKNGKIEESSNSYRKGIYNALNSLCSYLEEVGYLSKIKLSKPISRTETDSKREKVFLNENDFHSILDAAKRNTKSLYSWRDQAILAIFMTTGVRKAGLRAINVEDIDLEKAELTVIDKNHKTHIYKLNDRTMEIINTWLKYRDRITYGYVSSDALFICEKFRTRMSEAAISKVVEKYTQKALGKKLRPHKLRAGYCSILYEKTGNIEFVRRAVGHSRVETTQRYIVTDENLEREKAANMMEDFL